MRHGLSRCGGAAWGTEPQVVGAAFAVFAVMRDSHLLSKVAVSPGDSCARGRAPERRGRRSAARTIRRILLLAPTCRSRPASAPVRWRPQIELRRDRDASSNRLPLVARVQISL